MDNKLLVLLVAFMLFSVFTVTFIGEVQFDKMFINSKSNQTIDSKCTKSKPTFKYYCKESFDWCLHGCIRHISRKYGIRDDYNRCIDMCEGYFGKHGIKRF